MRHELNADSRHRRAAAAAVLGVATLAAVTACSGGSAGTSGTGSSGVTGRTAPAAQTQPTRPHCPLTGLPTSKAAASRPALAVKIDNIAEAMPQAGLDNADLVVEEQVEGGLTRLFTVFGCTPAPSIGPIRSARTTDADLLALLHGAVFAYSGANPAVMPPIRQVPDTSLVSWDDTPSLFHVDTSRVAPHDVFGDSATLLHAGLSAHPGIHAPAAVFRYGAADPAATRAHSFSMAWPAASAAWTWHGKQWLRTQGGATDTTASGQRVSARNVVVMQVQLKDTGIRDVAGNPSPDDVVVGSGKAWVFRDGRVVAGTWKRAKATDGWSFTDHKGRALALTPGRTWVELLPDAASLHVTR